jgi:hypothetical protein
LEKSIATDPERTTLVSDYLSNLSDDKSGIGIEAPGERDELVLAESAQ